MKIKKNHILKNTFKLPVTGDIYLPETIDEVIHMPVIGRGSNLLIKNCKQALSFDLLNNFTVKGNTCYVEAGMFMPSLVMRLKKLGLGGFEYFTSIPGSLGGAITMNAGRGKIYGKYISDHVISVTALIKGKLVKLPKDECGFGYRRSRFQESNEIVVGAELNLSKFSEKALRERIDFVKKTQDRLKPNAGTIFYQGWGKSFKGKRVGGAMFSEMTDNWIINENGTFEDIMELINYTKINKKNLEIRIWE